MKKVKYHNVKFLVRSAEDISVYFAFEKEAKIFNRWSTMEDYFFKKHPKIKSLKQTQDRKTKKEFIERYVKDYYKSHKELIGKRMKEAETRWKKVEQKFFYLADKLFQKYPWPKGDYRAFVTIWNIFPRDISKKTFQLPYKGRIFKKVEAIIVHEMLHFLFYDYLFKYFPKYKKSQYSYAVWVLSEAFNEVIMAEPKWRKIFSLQLQPYPETVIVRKKIRELRKNKKTVKEILEELLPFVIQKYTRPPSK
ncbi:hypothetical protein KAU51_00795 [Candidatus Parcubacteria bacterium]|nr:hypothetical protein [Candidatus Parcubacteria bacterium]